MKFDYTNKEMLKNVYIHDSRLTEFKYHNEEQELSFILDNCWRNESPTGKPFKKYAVTFVNVFGFEMKTFAPWGGFPDRNLEWVDGAFYGNPITNKLWEEDDNERKRRTDGLSHARLIEKEKMMEFGLLMCSGDQLLVACECIEVCELLPDSTLSDENLLIERP